MIRRTTAAAAITLLATTLCHPQSGVKVIPPQVTEGSFAGSWYYTDPAFKIALFIDAQDGKVRLTYQLRSRDGTSYRTDASGRATYQDGDTRVQVTFQGSHDRKTDRIRGFHTRSLTSPRGEIREEGAFEIYRASRGDQLVLLYPTWTRKARSEGAEPRETVREDVMTIFRKAASVVVEFEELPF